MLKHLAEENLAKGGRKLINKSADTKIFIADNFLLALENLTNLNGNLRFLIGICKVLDIFNYSADTNANLAVKLRAYCVGDVLCNLLKLNCCKLAVKSLNNNYILLACGDNVIS